MSKYLKSFLDLIHLYLQARGSSRRGHGQTGHLRVGGDLAQHLVWLKGKEGPRPGDFIRSINMHVSIGCLNKCNVFPIIL